MIHKVLITNSFRHRRSLAANAICSVCNRGDGSILHLQRRSCEVAHQVWNFVSDNALPPNFLDEDVIAWLASNLRDNSYRRGGCWTIIFGVTWLVLWLSINEFIFHGKRVVGGAVGRKILCIVAAIHQSCGEGTRSSNVGKPLIDRGNICWITPHYNYVKMNCEGAVCKYDHYATVGWVLRNHWGCSCWGLLRTLGPIPSLKRN